MALPLQRALEPGRVEVIVPDDQAIELGQYDIGDRETLSPQTVDLLDDMTDPGVARLEYSNDYLGWVGLPTDAIPEYKGFFVRSYIKMGERDT